MIQISTDPSRKLVRAHMRGFLEVAEVEAFGRDEQAAVLSMGLKSGEFLLLVDTSECVIQSQDVVRTFQSLIANSPMKARRIAVSRERSMSRMQASRIVGIRGNTGVFATLAEAEAWLFAADDVAQAA